MKIKNTDINRKKSGYALLIALMLVSILTLGSTLLLHLSTQKALTENREVSQTLASLVAESGVHCAIAAIERGEETVDSDFEPIVLGDGTARITIVQTNVTGSASSDSDYYLLQSVGTWGNSSKMVGVLFRYTGEEVPPEVDELFQGALFCGGDATIGGFTDRTSIDLQGTGSMHANGMVNVLGGAEIRNGGSVSSCEGVDLQGARLLFLSFEPCIEADVTTPGVTASLETIFSRRSVNPSDYITGSIDLQKPEKKMINIDLEPFRVHAKANDVVSKIYTRQYRHRHFRGYSNFGFYHDCSFHDDDDHVFTDSYISNDEMGRSPWFVIRDHQEIRPKGGILWIEGNVAFMGRTEVDGCVIATGDIEIWGRMDHKSTNGLPAFMSVNGNVRLHCGAKVDGLVYSHNGDISVGSGAEINGAFVCPRGDFDDYFEGSVKYINSRPLGPNGSTVMQGGDTESSGSVTSDSDKAMQIVRWIW